ncbi:hypothetical protein ACM46_14730 [Chryseobacterium angstadtii]|uniref:Uncharacterized protein n=2 Tax=Chryseobacterium angstadtii TaxID=558151 RepID=A0A0J7L1W7_9FLAO|nr:hypothetical protein ACM46_14730 [Chryseobacterium angstadtii]
MKNSEEWKSNKKFIWISFILGFIFLFFSMKYLFSELPNKQNIHEIKGIFKEIKVNKEKRGGKSLTIHVKEYPEINFMIGSIAIKQMYFQRFMAENKPGDSVTFFIEKHEYNRKIIKSETIPFPENFLSRNNISIVEIHKKNTKYLSLNNYNEAHQNNNLLAILFFGGLGILMIWLGIKSINYYKTSHKQ